MSRIWFGIAFLCIAANCHGQAQGTAPAGTPGQSTDPDVRSKVPDPSAVEIPLYAGARVSDVLKALTDKGFHIKWSPEDVLPTMTLLEKPKATRIDKLLTEILAPWGMRADHNIQDGGYRVKPAKKKKADSQSSG